MRQAPRRALAAREGREARNCLGKGQLRMLLRCCVLTATQAHALHPAAVLPCCLPHYSPPRSGPLPDPSPGQFPAQRMLDVSFNQLTGTLGGGWEQTGIFQLVSLRLDGWLDGWVPCIWRDAATSWACRWCAWVRRMGAPPLPADCTLRGPRQPAWGCAKVLERGTRATPSSPFPCRGRSGSKLPAEAPASAPSPPHPPLLLHPSCLPPQESLASNRLYWNMFAAVNNSLSPPVPAYLLDAELARVRGWVGGGQLGGQVGGGLAGCVG